MLPQNKRLFIKEFRDKIEALRSINELDPEFNLILEDWLRSHIKICDKSPIRCMVCINLDTGQFDPKLVIRKLHAIWLNSEL